MPIYAYKCDTCGFAKDVLQKVSDPLLTECPSCGKSTFAKQLTAAGFQLKGSGWYATDFKGGSGGTSAPASAEGSGATEAAPTKPAVEGGAAASAVAAPSAAGCGGGCACHS